MISILLTALTETFQQPLMGLAINATVITKWMALMAQSSKHFLLTVKKNH